MSNDITARVQREKEREKERERKRESEQHCSFASPRFLVAAVDRLRLSFWHAHERTDTHSLFCHCTYHSTCLSLINIKSMNARS